MAPLGLERGSVRVVDYDPSWPEVFEQEKERLRGLLEDAILAIEHVGSTAIPGLSSKPIIDIALAVEKADEAEKWEPLLQQEGYTYFGDRESKGDYFFAKGPEEARTIYLHVVALESAKWKEYLLFRERLRANPDLRQAYGELKQKLALEYPADRESYSRDKANLIAAILRG